MFETAPPPAIVESVEFFNQRSGEYALVCPFVWTDHDRIFAQESMQPTDCPNQITNMESLMTATGLTRLDANELLAVYQTHLRHEDPTTGKYNRNKFSVNLTTAGNLFKTIENGPAFRDFPPDYTPAVFQLIDSQGKNVKPDEGLKRLIYQRIDEEIFKKKSKNNQEPLTNTEIIEILRGLKGPDEKGFIVLELPVFPSECNPASITETTPGAIENKAGASATSFRTPIPQEKKTDLRPSEKPKIEEEKPFPEGYDVYENWRNIFIGSLVLGSVITLIALRGGSGHK